MIKLSLVERTTLANQNRILAHLTGDETYTTNAEILEGGYTGAYDKALLVDEETSPEICEETSQILQMYRVITNSFAALSLEEQAGLDMDRIAFEGFDGHEPHFHYASFMIENLNLWQEYEGRYLDSHTGASIRKYRKMLAIFSQRYGHPNYELSRETLQEMIEAQGIAVA